MASSEKALKEVQSNSPVTTTTPVKLSYSSKEASSLPPASARTRARVEELLTHHGLSWGLHTPIEQWVESLEEDYPEINLALEIRSCDEWWQRSPKTLKAPDRAIRNWLKREIRMPRPKPADPGKIEDALALRKAGGEFLRYQDFRPATFDDLAEREPERWARCASWFRDLPFPELVQLQHDKQTTALRRRVEAALAS